MRSKIIELIAELERREELEDAFISIYDYSSEMDEHEAMAIGKAEVYAEIIRELKGLLNDK